MTVQFVVRVLEVGTAPVRELARLGSDSLLAAVLARLGGSEPEEASDAPAGAAAEPEDQEPLPAEVITWGLLAGHGRFTGVEVADRAGMGIEDACRLWRALGFPEVGDEQRVFTSADVAALTDVARLVAADIVDTDGLVELARPQGHLLSRLAAAQTGFTSEVLGARLAAGRAIEDPQLPDQLAMQAVAITQELLPVLERTTVYAWRRHLATEVGRALLPTVAALDNQGDTRPAAVGFIDISGFTRLSRNVDLTELAAVLERFETLVLDTVIAHGGRVIKNIGDEVLFVTDDPTAAAEATLQVLEAITADKALPRVHAGLAFGPVLYRGGDVFGPVVNIAARIASLARQDTIRVDEAMATALGDTEAFTLFPRVPRSVRGYLQLRSYRLRRAHPH